MAYFPLTVLMTVNSNILQTIVAAVKGQHTLHELKQRMCLYERRKQALICLLVQFHS